MLITSAVISVIALAAYSGLSAGIRVWQRINQKSEYEDLAFFLDRLGSDLRNCFKFSGIDFLGEKDQVSFASLVHSPRLRKTTVGELNYTYEAQEGVIYRREMDYSHIYSQDEGLIKEALTGVKSLEFRFYVYDEEQKKYFWLEEFDRDELPLAVRVELELSGGWEKVVRTFNIPLKYK